MTHVRHLMIDIETTAVDPDYNAAITSVGLVVFTSTEQLAWEKINLDVQWSPGARNRDTYEWWQKQDERVRTEMFGGRVLPWDACDITTGLVARYKPAFVWGYPARFDIGHLRQLYAACGREFPMKFWQERDLSTLLWMARNVLPSLGDELRDIKKSNDSAHDALADARTQAIQVQAVMQAFPSLINAA